MKPLHETHASARGAFENIYMNGQEVFKFAVRAVPTVCLSLLQLSADVLHSLISAFEWTKICI